MRRGRRMGLDCLAPVILVLLTLLVAGAIQAWAQPATSAKTDAAAACKAYDGGPCCDREVARHLSRYAIFNACRETSETYLGERGGKDTCRYMFRPKQPATAGSQKDDEEAAPAPEGHVEVFAPAQAEVPEQPEDPFFAWAKVGKAYVTYKAKTPKSAPLLAASTGIWLPGDGYFVSVNASTRVCTRGEAQKLAKSVR